MTDTNNEDPAVIERQIRETQNNMSSTIDKIGDQLSVKNIFNAMLDKAEASDVDARMVLDGARRNPVALGLIAAGTIWLISDKDAKIPSFGLKKSKSNSRQFENGSDHQSDYVSHMSAVEQRSDEDAAAYQRRRDLARSNFFMVERGHEEDDSSFRQRLDAVAETYRKKRRAWADSSGQVRDATREKAAAAAGRTKDAYSANPLIGGIVAAAVGAAVGSALPVTQRERNTLGTIGGKARDAVGQQAEKATSKFYEKKDELVNKAEDALRPKDTASTSAFNFENAESPTGPS